MILVPSGFSQPPRNKFALLSTVNPQIWEISLSPFHPLCVDVPLLCIPCSHIFSRQSQLPRDGLCGELWPRRGGRGRQLGLRLEGHGLPRGEAGRKSLVVGMMTAEVLALKHESRILGQWSNPVSGSRKSQASSPWAKQHRV